MPDVFSKPNDPKSGRGNKEAELALVKDARVC
jgi:hypothetical protein